jgi:hypothetical protein
MGQNIVIGKNSSVYKTVASRLGETLAISHTEVFKHDFTRYEKIIIFSWSHSVYEDNLKILSYLPLAKVVFISTVAVLSLQLRRQFCKYPIWKKRIEDHVLAGGGKIIRLGICDPNLKKKFYGVIPITYPETLASTINNCSQPSRDITYAFDLEEGQVCGWKFFLGTLGSILSTALPPYAIFQAGISLTLRMAGVLNYGYTGDALRYFNKTLLVGYGVLGDSFYQAEKNKRLISVVVSYEPNRRLDHGGFRNTIIGYYRTGLARTWHGVSVAQGENGAYTKEVPIYNRRPHPPRGHLKGNCSSFLVTNKIVETKIKLGGKELSFFSSKIALAAGAIENIRILQKSGAQPAKLSDHEVGMLGTIDCDEAVAKGILVRYGKIIRSRKVLIENLANLKVLIDLRPFVECKHATKQEDGAFYLDSTHNLIRKLIFGLSLSRINEAFFNKIGFGIKTKRISVCCQILAQNAVAVHPDGNLTRTRVSEDQLELLQRSLCKKFSTYLPDDDPVLIDSQHLLGGGEVFCSEAIKRSISGGYLVILGSPTAWRLGAAHHTSFLRASIKNGTYNPLEPINLI